MNALALYEYLGGHMGSYEDEISAECENLELDPTNAQHRELVQVEDESNYAYYMCEVGECPEGIEVTQPRCGHGEEGVVIFVEGTDRNIDLPCKVDDLIPELDEETQERVDRLKKEYPDVTFEWTLDESSY